MPVKIHLTKPNPLMGIGATVDPMVKGLAEEIWANDAYEFLPGSQKGIMWVHFLVAIATAWTHGKNFEAHFHALKQIQQFDEAMAAHHKEVVGGSVPEKVQLLAKEIWSGAMHTYGVGWSEFVLALDKAWIAGAKEYLAKTKDYISPAQMKQIREEAYAKGFGEGKQFAKNAANLITKSQLPAGVADLIKQYIEDAMPKEDHKITPLYATSEGTHQDDEFIDAPNPSMMVSPDGKKTWQGPDGEWYYTKHYAKKLWNEHFAGQSHKNKPTPPPVPTLPSSMTDTSVELGIPKAGTLVGLYQDQNGTHWCAGDYKKAIVWMSGHGVPYVTTKNGHKLPLLVDPEGEYTWPFEPEELEGDTPAPVTEEQYADLVGRAAKMASVLVTMQTNVIALNELISQHGVDIYSEDQVLVEKIKSRFEELEELNTAATNALVKWYAPVKDI